MKNALFFLASTLFLFSSCSNDFDSNDVLKASFSAESSSDESAVKAAAMDYIECFYEADTTKAYRSVSPLLQKRGYGYSDKKQKYSSR